MAWPIGEVNVALPQYADENCAMCAVAKFMHFNTKGVEILLRAELALHGIPIDLNYQAADFFVRYTQAGVRMNPPHDMARHAHLQAQLYGIREFLRRRGHAANFMGGVDDQLADEDLINAMRQHPNGTRYIVFLNHLNGFDAHYNYAEMIGGNPVFFDYQRRPMVQGQRPIWPEDAALGDEYADAPRHCVAIANR